MKNLITILLMVAFMVMSCDSYEDIWNKLKEHEQRIEQLEKQCHKLNSNIEAIQTALEALQQNDYVTEVMKIVEGGVEVGYCLTFAKGGTVTIYCAADGATDTALNIGIKKASDGAYYWTVDDEWLTDDNGSMISATVSDPDAKYVTPQFRVADGVWYVSYDNGNSWRKFDGVASSCIVSVTQDSQFVYLRLSDGLVIPIPYGDITDDIYATSFHCEEDALYNKVINDIDGKTVTLVIGTDTHAMDEARYAYGKVMRKLGERLNANAIVHLGDMINEDRPNGNVQNTSKEVHYSNSIERLSKFMEELESNSIPVLYAIGHHEAYPWIRLDGTMWNYELIVPTDGAYNFPLEKVSGICNRFNRGLVKTVDDNDTCNYYVDFDMQKLRCIFINSVDNFVSFSDSTLEWISKVLNDTPKNYKVSFFAHAPNIQEANHRNQTPIPNGPELVEIMNDYVDNGGTILGYYHGHTHMDNIVKTDDMKFHLISTTCAQPVQYTGSGIAIPSLGACYAPKRAAGTYTEYAYDIVNIHTDTDIINIYRFGAGKSRQITPNRFGEMPETSVQGVTMNLDDLCGRDIWHDYSAVDTTKAPVVFYYDEKRLNRTTAYFVKLPVGAILTCDSAYDMIICRHTEPTAASYTSLSGWVSSYTITEDMYWSITLRKAGIPSPTYNPGIVGKENTYKAIKITVNGKTDLKCSKAGDTYIITAE